MTNLDTKHEKALIEMLSQKVECVGAKTAIIISENFDSLQEFLKGTRKDFEEIKSRKNRQMIKSEVINKIIDINKKIPKNLTVRETAFFVLADHWLTTNLNHLKELELDKIEINPFLAKALSLKSANEIITFNVYQSVTRSIVTSWGMMVENFLIYAGAEKNKTTFTTKEGANPDIKKETTKGYDYFQIKSGPNTMNVSMVNSLNDVITEMKKSGETCYLGMTYGKRNRISSQITNYLKDVSSSTLIGKELWDHISEEKNYHKKVIGAISNATNGMLKKSFSQMMNDKISEINVQWRSKYGKKSLEEVFEDYL
jgi:hypothetical protein